MQPGEARYEGIGALGRVDVIAQGSCPLGAEGLPEQVAIGVKQVPRFELNHFNQKREAG